VYFGKDQDHFADDLSLGRWQLEERFKNIPILVGSQASLQTQTKLLIQSK